MQKRDVIMVTLGFASAATAAWIATQVTQEEPATSKLASGAYSNVTEDAPSRPPSASSLPRDVFSPPAGVTATPVVSGPLQMTVSLEHGALRNGESEALAMIEVASSAGEGESQRAPTSLALVLDVSGSMQGNKLHNAKKALRGLVESLSEGDQLSLITFDSEANVVVERQLISKDRRRIFKRIDRVQAIGGTCVSCGMEAGYKALKRAHPRFHRRLLLVSDGEANTGTIAGWALANEATAAYATDDIVTSTIGLGRDIDGSLLTQVSSGGTGGYYFVRNSSIIPEILEREQASFGTAVARHVWIDVNPINGAASSGSTEQEARLRVGDLRPGERRRFLIPLSLVGDATGRVLQARATFRGSAGGKQTPLITSASVKRVDTEAEFAASRDWAISAERVRKEAAKALSASLVGLSHGNNSNARRLLRASRQQLMMTGEQLRLLNHEDHGAVKAQLHEVNQLLNSLADFKPGSDHLHAALLTHEATAHERFRGVGGGDSYHNLFRHIDIELE